MADVKGVVEVTGVHLRLGGASIYERRWAKRPAASSSSEQKHRGLVYLCHGYAEHCGYFHQLAECLATAGFLVVGQDYFGHGLSDGNVNQLKSFDTFVEHVVAHLAKLRLEFPDLIAHGVGYSMGALILHRVTARNSQLLNGGTVWLSPALQPIGLRLTKRRVQLSKQLMQYLPNMPLPGGRFCPADLTRSKETQEQMSKDSNIKQRVLYTRFCALMLEAMLLTTPDGVCSPILVATGTADKIADAARTASFVSVAQSMGKPVVGRVYPGGMHQLHTDVPIPLHQEMLQWLSKQTP